MSTAAAGRIARRLSVAVAVAAAVMLFAAPLPSAVAHEGGTTAFARITVSGQTVTFHGVGFNSTLSPGASGEFGFQASRPNGNTALPTATCRTP